MIFNSSLNKTATKNDKRLWIQTMNVILLVSDYLYSQSSFGKHNFIVECHSICRALSMRIPELKVVDGHCLGLQVTGREGNEIACEIRCCDHSWLETPDEAIIDPYPVGFISTNPLLIVGKGTYTPWGKEFYQPTPTVTQQIGG